MFAMLRCVEAVLYCPSLLNATKATGAYSSAPVVLYPNALLSPHHLVDRLGKVVNVFGVQTGLRIISKARSHTLRPEVLPLRCVRF